MHQIVIDVSQIVLGCQGDRIVFEIPSITYSQPMLHSSPPANNQSAAVLQQVQKDSRSPEQGGSVSGGYDKGVGEPEGMIPKVKLICSKATNPEEEQKQIQSVLQALQKYYDELLLSRLPKKTQEIVLQQRKSDMGEEKAGTSGDNPGHREATEAGRNYYSNAQNTNPPQSQTQRQPMTSPPVNPSNIFSKNTSGPSPLPVPSRYSPPPPPNTPSFMQVPNTSIFNTSLSLMQNNEHLQQNRQMHMINPTSMFSNSGQDAGSLFNTAPSNRGASRNASKNRRGISFG